LHAHLRDHPLAVGPDPAAVGAEGEMTRKPKPPRRDDVTLKVGIEDDRVVVDHGDPDYWLLSLPTDNARELGMGLILRAREIDGRLPAGITVIEGED
jgi:hypothetical protein